MSRGVAVCRHCGDRIVLMHYALGDQWTHQVEGAAFRDGVHEYCHRTVAEPAEGAQ